MKKIFIALLAALMLTACGNSGTEDAAADTSSTAVSEITTVETTTVTTTAATTTAATTKRPEKTPRELEEESKKIIIRDLNSARKNSGLEELENTDELDLCARQLTQEFAADEDVFHSGVRADGSNFATVLNDNYVTYEECIVLYGQTRNYSPRNISDYVSDECGVWSEDIWDSFGFHYDQKSYFWVAILCDAVSGQFFYNSTTYETLITYLDALVRDDYEAYLAITLLEDNAETRKDYDYYKEGYVGADIGNILYYETQINMLYGSSACDYKVVEFEDDGTYKFDINTFDNAYGTIRIDEHPSGGYYVSAHIRYTPFFMIN